MRASQRLKKVGMVYQRIILILVCLVLLVSCAYPTPVIQATKYTSPAPGRTPRLPDPSLEPSQTASPGTAIPGTPEPNTSPQVTPPNGDGSILITAQYALVVVFNYYQHTLSVSETISYVNY